MQNFDETKRRRRFGPEPKTSEQKRTHCVSSRLNTLELAELDERRKAVNMERGEYMRCAALGVPPTQIPELNREMWVSLSRSASNLNQLNKRLAILFSKQESDAILEAIGLIDTLKLELSEFRNTLIGANLESEDK